MYLLEPGPLPLLFIRWSAYAAAAAAAAGLGRVGCARSSGSAFRTKGGVAVLEMLGLESRAAVRGLFCCELCLQKRKPISITTQLNNVCMVCAELKMAKFMLFDDSCALVCASVR